MVVNMAMTKKIKLSAFSKKNIISIFLLILALLVEWYLFTSYVNREVAPYAWMDGDQVWYLHESYKVFENFLNSKIFSIDGFNEPRGRIVYIFSTFVYLVFGVSRISALTTNLLFYLCLQVFTFFTIRHLSRSNAFAFAAIGLWLVISFPYTLGGLMSYHSDFVTFCTFGMFLLSVLLSDTFLDRKWSIISGVFLSIMILSRYVVISYMSLIYFSIFCVFSISLLIKNKHKKNTVKEKIRMLNIILSYLASTILIAFPLFLARKAIYMQYFHSKFVKPDKVQIEAYSYSMDVLEKLKSLIVPFIIGEYGLGKVYVFCILVISISLLFLFLFTLLLREKDNNVCVSRFSPIFIFLVFCLFIPLMLFMIFPMFAYAVMLPLAAPTILGTIIFLMFLISKFPPKATILKQLTFIIVTTIVIIFSSINLISAYSKHSFASNNHNSLLEVSRMYDDIIATSKKTGLKELHISVDYPEFYTLGCALNLASYQYEKTGELYTIQSQLGNDIMSPVNLQTALRYVRDSKFVIMHPYIGNKKSHYAGNIFASSIAEIRPKLYEYVKKNMCLIDTYKILNQSVEVYFSKDMGIVDTYNNVTFDAENNEYPGKNVLKLDNRFWEIIPPWPHWILFDFNDNPKKITKYVMKSGSAHGVGALKRMPKEWYFQASADNVSWITLDVQKDQSNWEESEKRIFELINNEAYNFYRLTITNGNEPTILRLYGFGMIE